MYCVAQVFMLGEGIIQKVAVEPTWSLAFQSRT